MKKLSLAVVIVLAGAALCFLATRALLINEDLMGSVYETALPRSIGGLVLVTIAYVHGALMTRRARASFTALPSEVVPFDPYLLPWYTMVIYGTFMLLAASGAGTLIIWAIGEITGFYFTTAISAINTLFVAVGFYLIGSWIGSRCDRHRFLALVLILFLFQLITTIFAALSGSSSILSLALTLIPTTPLYLVIAVVGLWRGSRLRSSRYLQYLLRFTRPAERAALLNQTYEEVKRLYPEHLKEDVQVA